MTIHPQPSGNHEHFAQKVLMTFVDEGRLVAIPARRKKRDVVLRWLVEIFETDKRYSEREVSELIGMRHPDYATLRRELVGSGLMKRETGIYWRL